jgi:hypothetical protein
MTGVETTPLQSICIAALYGDLVLNTLLHDARGGLLAVCGWMELAVMNGKTIAPGLEQGVESLSKILTTVEHNSLLPTSGLILAGELMDGLPGAQVPTESLHVQACPEFFRTVLSLAAPERIEVTADTLSNRAIVTITGLAVEGVCLAGYPDLSRLAALRADPLQERSLGAALLRPLAWACGGSLLRSEATMVQISLPRE